MLEMLLLHSDQEPVPMTHSDWFPGEYKMRPGLPTDNMGAGARTLDSAQMNVHLKKTPPDKDKFGELVEQMRTLDSAQMNVHLKKASPDKDKFGELVEQQIHDLLEEDSDRKFAQSLYTEENLITVQNIFVMCVRYKFDPEIINKVNFLQDHWYKKVKEEEEKARKASEIVTIVLTKYFETKKYDDKEISENNEKNVEIEKENYPHIQEGQKKKIKRSRHPNKKGKTDTYDLKRKKKNNC